jgi:hypothetical protein
MVDISKPFQWFDEKLVKFQDKAKPFFSGAALILYIASLVGFLYKAEGPITFNAFLIQALVSLSIPFGVILLQELLELITFISDSSLRATQRQFQIVVLVLLRSFFKDFSKLNIKVTAGVFAEPVQNAVVKLFAVAFMIALIVCFRRLSKNPVIQRYGEKERTINLYKEMMAIVLLGVSLFVVITDKSWFSATALMNADSVTALITLVFTGMIIVDAIFFIVSIARGHEFNRLAFEASIVISLIFARFAIFANNILGYSLSTLGVAFATGSLFLLSWSQEEEPIKA